MSLMGLNSTYFGINGDYMDSLFSFSSGSKVSNNGFDTSLYTDLSSFSTRNLRNLLKMSQQDSEVGNIGEGEELTAFADVKAEATKLKESATALTNIGINSALGTYKAESSNTEAISSASTKSLRGKEKSMTVDIKQIAQSQRNSASALKAKDKSTLEAGSYTFEINNAGAKTSISFSVSVSDTNESVNEKIAKLINNSKSGIIAKVNTSEEKTFLTIEGEQTGEKNKVGNENSFTITDKYSSGAITKLGLDNVTRKNQNAIYSVDGGANRESASNEVKLDYNTTAVLKAVTKESVKLKFTHNQEIAKDKITEFVKSYNDLMKTINYNSNNSNIRRLGEQLSNITDINKYALERVGISVDYEGMLNIDSKKLASSNAQDLKEIFGGPRSYSDRIANKANMISNSVMRHGQESYRSYGKDSKYNNSYLSGGFYNNFL